MDQIKVGKFIAECRKKQSMTQMQLAEKLGITDRAVSKWENGKAMPDSSLMLELCDALEITVNDLLNGEKVSAEDYNKKLEQQLLEMVQQKQYTDKSLLTLNLVLSLAGGALYLSLLAIMWFGDLNDGALNGITALALTVPFVIWFIALRLDYKAGYYRCQKCGMSYVPPFIALFNAFTWGGRSKCFRCRHCKKLAWHKKVLTKE